MRRMKPIITTESLKLDDGFDDIKKKIETESKYDSLKKLCKFNIEKKRLVYPTEGIYPNRSEHTKRIPVLFLFSNPYPESVEIGLFLSEPHSRTFWQRLFESEYLCLPVRGIDLKHWGSSTAKQLGRLMLKGEYKSHFLLYFHCLWPIPTKKPEHLKSLFKSKARLWAAIERSSMEELARLTKNEQIKHIVAFAGPTFKAVTGVNENTYKGWRDRIKHAVDDYRKDEDLEKYWESLSGGYAKTRLGQNDVEVYLGLDTRSKNLGKEMEKRYFTWAFDMIFSRILKDQPPIK